MFSFCRYRSEIKYEQMDPDHVSRFLQVSTRPLWMQFFIFLSLLYFYELLFVFCRLLFSWLTCTCSNTGAKSYNSSRADRIKRVWKSSSGPKTTCISKVVACKHVQSKAMFVRVITASKKRLQGVNVLKSLIYNKNRIWNIRDGNESWTLS